MFLLSETKNNRVAFILQPRNYTQLYNKLKTVLRAEHYTFFARPDVLTDSTNWSSEFPGDFQATDVLHFDQLNDEDKDTIADYVESIKAEIASILSQNNEFESILKDLFIIPAARDIKVLKTEQGLKPVLTQWGCRSNEVTSAVDPLSVVINRPRITTAKVIIEVFYSDGSKATNKPFYIHYAERDSREKTNKDGLYDRGRCRLNTSFEVYDIVKEQKAYPQTFTVTPDGKYVVTFPLFVNGQVRVVNQKGTPMADIPVLVDQDGEQFTRTTAKNGAFPLEDLEVGKRITIKEADNPDNAQTFTVLKEQNEFVLKIVRPLFANATVKVIDDQDELQRHFPVLIEYDGSQRDTDTGENGSIDLQDLEVGKTVKVAEKNKISNFQTYTVAEEANEFVLKIEKPEAKFVQVKLIDHKNQPLPGIPIDFSYNGQIANLTTNTEGVCILPYESFTDREKVQAMVRLTRENKKGERKEKLVKKRFVFKNEQLEYVIKLRKISRWWWLLLLLLLPLLLLIRCEKTVYVKTVDAESGAPYPGADVYFGYRKAFLYDAGRFFTNDSMGYRKPSDPNGIAGFEKLEYSVYSWIFKRLSPALVYAQSTCFTSDTLTPYFHSLDDKDTLILPLHPAFIAIDFKVIDKKDGQPLPDATVNLITELNGKQYTESAVSGADGRAVFNRVPKCGKIAKVVGEAEGYYPDSLPEKPVQDIVAGPVDQKRLLQLTPKEGQFSFFIQDCKTKRPIAGAVVTIDVDYNGRKTSKTKTTNVDGKGKGFADDYLIAKIHLSAKAPYYKKGELPGWHLISDFIDPAKYPDDKRTFCLEPEENCIDFKNIDEKTGKALAGVKNTVTIKNGGNVRTDTVISASDGKFPVCGVTVGDKISIISQYPPDYEDNNTKVVDADGIGLKNAPAADRTIPLKPREVDLTFRTVDADDGSVIDNADLQITVDGLPVPPSNSGAGEFTVKAAVTSLISITASKPGYGSNSTKINNMPVKLLEPPAPQSDRDIPLQKDPPPPPPPPDDVLPCNQPVSASSGTSGEMYFQLGSKSYDFTLEYDMASHPDEITIYCGRGTTGRILFRKMASYSYGAPQQIHFDANECNGIITVTIVPFNEDQGSVWKFRISCP